MHIKSVRVKNYRCFEDSGVIEFSKFSVIIGRNDGGKSSLFVALQRAIDPKASFDNEDFRKRLLHDDNTEEEPKIEPVSPIVIEIQFASGSEELRFRLVQELGQVAQREVFRDCVGDPALDQDFGRLSLQELRELCEKYHVEPNGARTAKSSYLNPLMNYKAQLSTSQDWVPATTEELGKLPKVYLYRSESGEDPEAVITKSLEHHFRNTLISEYSDQLARLRSETQSQLSERARELVPILQHHCSSIKDVSVDVDDSAFTNLRLSRVRITQTDGRDIVWGQIGAGKKREISLGLFRWQQELLLDELSEEQELENRPIVAIYDEPDTSLDYQAQRQVSNLLNQLSQHESCQVLVATHSLNLIDAVPLCDVTFFEGNSRLPWRFEMDGSEADFIENLRHALGLRNSALLNEKILVIVEGDTEIEILRVLYHAIHNTTMVFDGIYLINGHNNSDALRLAKVLSKTKRVILILDNDCKKDNNLDLSGDENQIRHTHGFTVNETLFFLGQDEVEDLFCDDTWYQVLLSYQDYFLAGQVLSREEITELRDESKFSEALHTLVEKKTGSRPGKPELGRLAARIAVQQNRVPAEIEQLCKEIRKLCSDSA